MALTIANVNAYADDVWGRHRIRLVTVTFDNSYPTGGELFTPANVGMSQIDAVFVSSDHTPAYNVAYDYVNQRLVVSGVEQDADAAVTDPFDEENAAADLSTLVIRVLVVGF